MTLGTRPGHLPTALVLALAFACCACTGRPLQGVLIPAAQSATGVSRVPILVATTRQRSTTDPGDMFSGDPASEVSHASIKVSIPPDGARKIGQIQWPTSLPGDPTRDFVTASAEYIDKQSFNKAISAEAKSTGRNESLGLCAWTRARKRQEAVKITALVTWRMGTGDDVHGAGCGRPLDSASLVAGQGRLGRAFRVSGRRKNRTGQ